MTKPLALGFLDTPAAGDTVHPGALTVSGWALFDGLPASRVEVFLGDHRLGRALTGIDRADVAAVHEGPGAAVSGFSLTVDPGNGAPATLDYRVALPPDDERAPGGMAEAETSISVQNTSI